jgi:NADPH2:quinone reductase
MRAIWVTEHGSPEVLTLTERPIPEPGSGQVLVRVAAAGVNPVDTYLRAGAYSSATVPYTPGFDGAGTIQAVGSEVGNFQKGDRVYTSVAVTGTYAEFALCNAATVYPLPATITFAQGAALGIPYATAYRALFQRGGARAGETVLVHGASGGVGLAAVQFAKAAGLIIIGTAGTPEGRQLAADNGAHHVLDHGIPDYPREIMRLTDGRGVDLILEMLANINLGKDLTLLAKFGRVVVIGSRGPIEIDPRETMSRDASILGMTLFNATPEDLAGIHAAIRTGLLSETLRPIVGREFPLAEAAQAHREVLAPGARGKIVLVP